VSTVLSMILGLRLSSGLFRFYFEYDTKEGRDHLVSTCTIFIVLMSLGALLALTSSRDVISTLVFRTTDYADYFIFVFFALVFEIGNTVALSYLRILEKSVLYVLISVVQLAVGLGLNIYLIVFLEMGVQGVLWSMVISNGLVWLFSLVYIFANVGLHFEGSKLKQPLVFGIPMIPAGLLIFILNMGDRFLLKWLSDLSEVGIYSLGYKFGMLLSFFVGTPFAAIWGPKRVEIYKNSPDRDEIYARVFTYLVFILLFLGLAISVLVRNVLTVMAEPEYWPACHVVPFVVAGYFFYNIYYYVDIGFYINNKTYWYPTINGIAAATNIGLNFILIPRFGAMGAAVTTTISFAVCPILAVLISSRYYKIPYDVRRLIQLVVATGLIYVVSITVSASTLWLDLLVKGALLIVYPVTLYFIGFFEAREVQFIKLELQRRLHFKRTVQK
jgi:O-antigen/teichoic acid export membrane protein